MLSPDLDELARSRDAALRPWLVRAVQLVRNRVRDARAHAEAGRHIDANQRLMELRSGLVQDILEPARERFYWDAFRDHRRHLTARGYPIVDRFGSDEGAKTARSAVVAGTNQHFDIAHATDHAHDELALATAARELDDERPTVHHDLWERRHSERLSNLMKTHLSDAQVAIGGAVLRLLSDPDIV
jgi:hypothetical protein